MKNRYASACVALLVTAACAYAQPSPESRHDNGFHGPFIENFSNRTSEFFRFNYRPSGYDTRYFPGVMSISEKGTDVMMYRIDPEDPAGAGKGPEIISRKYTSYGTYMARIRIPDVKAVQPDLGAVVGYFTYNIDDTLGQSEIDFEWLVADPELIYVGAWTGVRPAHNRVGRIINLATGEIYDTSYRSESIKDGKRETAAEGKLTGKHAKPKKISLIEGYDASSRFYIYGWDWHPDRLTWWIINPDTNEKIVLWDYEGKDVFPGQPSVTGIPVAKTRYRLNFWHTDNWPAETNPDSVEKPLYPYELEIDWMSYEPYDETSK